MPLDDRERTQHAPDVIQRFQKPGRQKDRTDRNAFTELESVQLDNVMYGTRSNPESPEDVDQIPGGYDHRVGQTNRGERTPPPILQMIFGFPAPIVQDDFLGVQFP